MVGADGGSRNEGAGGRPEGAAVARETHRVPGTDAGVRQAADALERFAAGCGIAAEIRWRVLVALDEALSNVVHHGYAGQSGEVEVMFAVSDTSLTIAVSDTAPPFNPLLAPQADTTVSLSSRRVGGLGLTLVRALMDDVQYERREGHNRLVLVRRLRHD